MSVIDDYRKCSDEDKAEFLRDLEFEDVPEKWQLFRSVIADTSEYDLARVQALEILEIAEVPEGDLRSFCELLVAVIRTDTDYDVKNYAAMASANFINHSDELQRLVIELLLAAGEDIDIRHNALSAVEKITDVAARKAVLEQLVADKEMGSHASRILSELE